MIPASCEGYRYCFQWAPSTRFSSLCPQQYHIFKKGQVSAACVTATVPSMLWSLANQGRRCLIPVARVSFLHGPGSYGDMNKAYLRGQLTIHKILPKVDDLWRHCTELSDYSFRVDVSISVVLGGVGCCM